MNAQERIREQRCGCRYDVVTGLCTHRCDWHAAPPERLPHVWARDGSCRFCGQPRVTSNGERRDRDPCPNQIAAHWDAVTP